MDLCHDCDGLAVAISKRLESWPGLDSFWDAARRRAGSRDCRLCKMMSDYIFDNPDVNAPVPPTLSRIYYGPTDREGDALSFVRFLGVFGKPPLYYSDISVWSDLGRCLGYFTSVPKQMLMKILENNSSIFRRRFWEHMYVATIGK